MIPGGSQEDVLAESVLKGKSEGAKGRMDKACQAEGAVWQDFPGNAWRNRQLKVCREAG